MVYFASKYKQTIGDPKPEKEPKKQWKKPTGEQQVFQRIIRTRKLESFVSGTPIANPKPINFAHVLPKGQNQYPEFKLLDTNIQLLTEDEHHDWDHNRSSLVEKPEWHGMFVLEEYLLELYNTMLDKVRK